MLHYGRPETGLKLQAWHDLHGRADDQCWQGRHPAAGRRLDHRHQGSQPVGAVGAHGAGRLRRVRGADAVSDGSPQPAALRCLSPRRMCRYAARSASRRDARRTATRAPPARAERRARSAGSGLSRARRSDSAALLRLQAHSWIACWSARVWRECADAGRECALLAVGGYGRGTLFPYSDVDVLMLLPDAVDDDARDEVSDLVGQLWDIGLELGHSVRTVDECIAKAAQDMTVQTNLLEARRVAGSRTLYRAVRARAIQQALDPRAFFEAKLLEQQQRHDRFNDTAYNLEPNIKESPGGLRDLTNILWIARRQLGSAAAGATLANHAHHHAGGSRRIGQPRARPAGSAHPAALPGPPARRSPGVRSADAAGAAVWACQDTPAKRASEQLMQRYYRTARAVTQLNEIILQNLRAIVFPRGCRTGRAARTTASRCAMNCWRQCDEEHVRAGAARDPGDVRAAAAASRAEGYRRATLRALWRSARRIDADVPSGSGQSHALHRHVPARHPALPMRLRRMNRYDVLGRYLPPFGRIVGQMQHDCFTSTRWTSTSSWSCATCAASQSRRCRTSIRCAAG